MMDLMSTMNYTMPRKRQLLPMGQMGLGLASPDIPKFLFNLTFAHIVISHYLIPSEIQSTSHNSDHTGLADFVRITENPDYVETFLVFHFNRKLIGLSNSVRNVEKSG